MLAVVNQKGGVGKTTTVINAGAAIADRGHAVVVVDLDPQGNATSGLGIDPAREREGVYEVLFGSRPLADVLVASSNPGLRVAPSHRGLAGAEVELIGEPRRESRLRDALATLPDDVDLVLLDCPPSLGLLTLNAITAADLMLVPLQAEYFALEGLSHLIETQHLVRANLNPSLELGGILLTQFDARTALAWEVLQEVRRAYPNRVYRTLIPRNVRLGEAPSHGLPVTRYDPSCRGAVAYRELAAELLERLHLPAAMKESAS
ncbi:MAG: ParA family protein [Candidatus Dormibacteraeota bacterium]|nr:ParA family protein [Candidatus Dormibacteraeota bacterium]